MLSPLLANIALHGMETYLKAQFPATSYTQAHHRYRVNAVQVIRYADDFVVIHPNLAVIQAAKTALEQWLAPLGLQLKPSKTRIVHSLESRETASGFDFLGFEIRQYPVGKTQKPAGFKTLIKPSKSAIQQHRRRLRELVHRHQGDSQRQLIESLNRLIMGWSRYYSTVVSKQCFKTLDNDLRRALLRWTHRQSPKSNRRKQVARFWGIDRGLGWVFCTPQGFCLREHHHTPIR